MINNAATNVLWDTNDPNSYYASGIPYASAFPAFAPGLTPSTTIGWAAFNTTVPAGRPQSLIMQ